MATDNPVVTYNSDMTINTYSYAGLDNGDDGAPIKASEFADKTVQVFGTFGTGGNVVIEGSNNGTNYFTVSAPDTTDNLGAITAAAGYSVIENPLYLRPRVSAGDVTTDLTVIFNCRRPTDKRQ